MKKLFIPAILIAACTMLMWMVGISAPDASTQVPAFSFAVFGDNRPILGDSVQPKVFRTILQIMNDFKPAFAVNTGDCIFGSAALSKVQAQYKDYTDTVASFFPRKTYLAMGNHEVYGRKANQEFFAREMGGLYYSFDQGDSHFIVLNSEIVGEVGKITGQQLEWLKEDLHQSRAARHKFVFLHRPLYPVDGHKGECLDKYPKDRDILHNLFVRNRVTAVFMGHEHLLNVQRRNGVMYIITGGGGAPTYPSLEADGDFHHFVLVSVEGDKVEMKVVIPPVHGKPYEVLPVSKFLQE